MTLTLTIWHNLARQRRSVDWRVGTPRPALAEYEEIIAILADDRELVFIISDFKNIPIRLGRGKTQWRQPFANFIYDNLE